MTRKEAREIRDILDRLYHEAIDAKAYTEWTLGWLCEEPDGYLEETVDEKLLRLIRSIDKALK